MDVFFTLCLAQFAMYPINMNSEFLKLNFALSFTFAGLISSYFTSTSYQKYVLETSSGAILWTIGICVSDLNPEDVVRDHFMMILIGIGYGIIFWRRLFMLRDQRYAMYKLGVVLLFPYIYRYIFEHKDEDDFNYLLTSVMFVIALTGISFIMYEPEQQQQTKPFSKKALLWLLFIPLQFAFPRFDGISEYVLIGAIVALCLAFIPQVFIMILYLIGGALYSTYYSSMGSYPMLNEFISGLYGFYVSMTLMVFLKHDVPTFIVPLIWGLYTMPVFDPIVPFIMTCISLVLLIIFVCLMNDANVFDGVRDGPLFQTSVNDQPHETYQTYSTEHRPSLDGWLLKKKRIVNQHQQENRNLNPV